MSLTRSRDWFLIYGSEKNVMVRLAKMKHHVPNHCCFQEYLIWTVLRSEVKKLRN